MTKINSNINPVEPPNFDVWSHVFEQIKDSANIAKFGLFNKDTYAVREMEYTTKCIQEFQFTPSSQSYLIYHTIKKILEGKWSSDPDKKKVELIKAINILQAHITKHSWACYYLSQIYLKLGDIKAVINCLQEAVAKNDIYPLAAFELGNYYLQSALHEDASFTFNQSAESTAVIKHSVKPTKAIAALESARKHFQLLADKGYTSAQLQLALTYLTNVDTNHQLAIKNLMPIAGTEAEAAYILSKLYQNGLAKNSTIIKDAKTRPILKTLLEEKAPTDSIKKSKPLFEEASIDPMQELEHPLQKQALIYNSEGYILVNNQSYIIQDTTKACQYLEQAANAEHLPALTTLGIAYMLGNSYGIKQDAIKAEKYLQKAIAKGDKEAYQILKRAYRSGEGCIQPNAKKCEALAATSIELIATVIQNSQAQAAGFIQTPILSIPRLPTFRIKHIPFCMEELYLYATMFKKMVQHRGKIADFIKQEVLHFNKEGSVSESNYTAKQSLRALKP